MSNYDEAPEIPDAMTLKAMAVNSTRRFLTDRPDTYEDNFEDWRSVAQKIHQAPWDVGDVLVWHAVYVPTNIDRAQRARQDGLKKYIWAAVHGGDGQWFVTGASSLGGGLGHSFIDLMRILSIGRLTPPPGSNRMATRYHLLCVTLHDKQGAREIYSSTVEEVMAEPAYAASEKVQWYGGPAIGADKHTYVERTLKRIEEERNSTLLTADFEMSALFDDEEV